MSPNRTRIAVALATGAVAAALGASGCKAEPDLRALCDGVERCIGGNDHDVDACTDRSRLAQESAEIKGCGDEFDAYATCVVDGAACAERATASFCTVDANCTQLGLYRCQSQRCTTKSYAPPTGACEAEQAAYVKCSGGTGEILR